MKTTKLKSSETKAFEYASRLYSKHSDISPQVLEHLYTWKLASVRADSVLNGTCRQPDVQSRTGTERQASSPVQHEEQEMATDDDVDGDCVTEEFTNDASGWMFAGQAPAPMRFSVPSHSEVWNPMEEPPVKKDYNPRRPTTGVINEYYNERIDFSYDNEPFVSPYHHARIKSQCKLLGWELLKEEGIGNVGREHDDDDLVDGVSKYTMDHHHATWDKPDSRSYTVLMDSDGNVVEEPSIAVDAESVRHNKVKHNKNSDNNGSPTSVADTMADMLSDIVRQHGVPNDGNETVVSADAASALCETDQQFYAGEWQEPQPEWQEPYPDEDYIDADIDPEHLAHIQEYYGDCEPPDSPSLDEGDCDVPWFDGDDYPDTNDEGYAMSEAHGSLYDDPF